MRGQTNCGGDASAARSICRLGLSPPGGDSTYREETIRRQLQVKESHDLQEQPIVPSTGSRVSQLAKTVRFHLRPLADTYRSTQSVKHISTKMGILKSHKPWTGMKIKDLYFLWFGL